jgi:hypothetical protein
MSLPITLTFQAPDRTADQLQTDMEENLLPQIKEVAGVENAALAMEAAPDQSKADSGFIVGVLKFTIENSKILTGLLGVGNAIVGNGKTVKMTIKSKSGDEYSAEAKDLAELERMIQMAEASLERLD